MILYQAECNNNCKSNWDGAITRIQQKLQHKASYQCRKCRHEAVQSHQRTHLKGHLKTGGKNREENFSGKVLIILYQRSTTLSPHIHFIACAWPPHLRPGCCAFTLRELDEGAKLSSCAPGTWETEATTLSVKSTRATPNTSLKFKQKQKRNYKAKQFSNQLNISQQPLHNLSTYSKLLSITDNIKEENKKQELFTIKNITIKYTTDRFTVVSTKGG